MRAECWCLFVYHNCSQFACISAIFLRLHLFCPVLVHGQLTIIFVVSVVCLFVLSFSQLSDPISIKLGHILYVWV